MPNSRIPQHPVDTTELTFEGLGLEPDILRCIQNVGFIHPTPIQLKVIPIAVEGKDLIGLAQTGSGKTAAFALPMAQRLTHGQGLRGLIVCPTREIALQTKAFLDLFGKGHHLKTTCLIGGVAMGPQLTALKNRPDIVVATPGRLIDHLERRSIQLNQVQELVLDEADHMLDMGFMPQVETILRALPTNRHTMMFSATMPGPIERLTKRFLKDPARIDILPVGRAAENITHRIYMVLPENKRPCLHALLNQELGSTLVFARRKIDAEWLSQVLEREGHPVERIHSDRSQSERTSALQGFREGKFRILVATDIASRGIDVPGIEHVVNFDMPEGVEDYIHRAGRTARVNASGIVSTIVTWQDKPMIEELELALGKTIPRCTVAGVPPFVEIKRPASTSRFGRRRTR